jgi:glutamine amidotransferase
MLISIIDLGINNLTSVKRAFSLHLTSSDKIDVTNSNSSLKRPDLLILPGLGNFAAGMKQIRDRKLDDLIYKWTGEGVKIAGICLGMQLLGTESKESPGVKGLNIIKSYVEPLSPHLDEKIPNIGWATATAVATSNTKYFAAFKSKGDFYFVHSYHLMPEDEKVTLTRTAFGSTSFVSSILSQNVVGFQFHPEKSGEKGRQLISDICEWARSDED